LLADVRKLDFHIAPGHSAIDGTNHSRNIALDTWPACRGQNDDYDTPRAKVLLVPEIPIGSEKYLESFSFGCVE
jgi:hypothetical protein